MHKSDLASRFRTLETALEELIAAVSPLLTSEEVMYVREIISYSEYGDAFENLVAFLTAKRASLNVEQAGKLVSSWKLMGPGNIPLIEQLLTDQHGPLLIDPEVEVPQKAPGKVPHFG